MKRTREDFQMDGINDMEDDDDPWDDDEVNMMGDDDVVEVRALTHECLCMAFSRLFRSPRWHPHARPDPTIRYDYRA